MFRRLYWVTEECEPNGSCVTGVYTSIPDLIKHGLRWVDGPRTKLRLTLCKLDCAREPLGTFEGPDFKGLEERLADFVKTDEFSQDECKALVEALHSFSSAKPAV